MNLKLLMIRTTGTKALRRGFTLIEVLLALSIGMMVMTAASGMLFYVGQLWQNSETATQFEEHTESVSQFLEYILKSGSAEVATNSNSRSGLAWRKLPGSTTLDGEFLSFRVSGDLPLFQLEKSGAVADALVFLHLVEGKGLVLDWQTDVQIQENDKIASQTVLSRWVTAIEYHYYDLEDDNWEASDRMEEDERSQPRFPSYIKLKFTHTDSREAETYVLLPYTNGGFPSF